MIQAYEAAFLVENPHSMQHVGMNSEQRRCQPLAIIFPGLGYKEG